MVGVYLFCLGLGGVLLAASFFSDADAPDDVGGDGWQQFFSLRNLTYFLFVFGGIGSALAWLRGGGSGLVSLLAAVGGGLLASTAVHYLFAYLRRTDTAEVPSDRALIGLPAQVTLPVGPGGIGKIEVLYGGQRVELLARPFESSPAAAASIETGSDVVIVDMVAGTALVSRGSLET